MEKIGCEGLSFGDGDVDVRVGEVCNFFFGWDREEREGLIYGGIGAKV